MAVNKKIHEAGWFYHAPAKKQIGCPKTEAPAPSQIPGIGFDDPTILEKEEIREMMFKDTDSKYIQLAKMGGRKDLLAFNPSLYKKQQKGPSGYPRNEWFYLEDNRAEDEEKKIEESWDFLLPDYMVHKTYQPSFEDPSSTPTRGGAPYYTEKESMLQQEGRSATDKTIKIPEIRRPGFGVRNEKPPVAMKSIPKNSDTTQGEKRRGKKNTMTMQSENQEPTMMSKLMAGGYEKDWHEKHAEEDAKAQKKQPAGLSAGSQRSNIKENQNNSAPNTTAEEKVLFKLSRFKNIPSKITHQAVHNGSLAK